ncbi:DUF4139 domain-containing protein [Mucilaginibacter glaciei]|uniref:Mucoidy inhibitor MuiA family protein n=1 Tax=Mucilaginibacter glaciei TaxID=2772109 RepID=A0A926NR96_9SPHI|nr:DUF4139 domain-containing protein [Mucilaginibacter glaciei]MBD1394561.1 mucoidy inhibitor MuiA family protein [Mucilaginibacter glaciei]
MKKLLFMTCLLIGFQMVKAADGEQKITSKVQKVTVFLNSAQITRTALANLQAGTSTLVFENISPDIDVQSLQVKAPGEFTILSVKQEMNYLVDQTKLKHIDELRAQQKAIQDKIALLNNAFNVNQQEAEMLNKNQVVSGQNSGLDLLKLKQALDFQTQRLTDIKKRDQAIQNEINTLNADLRKYDKQIADIAKGRSGATSNVLVTVSSKTAVQSLFTLSYVVNNAGWYPTYDIRAKNVNSPITIAYKANVSQQCGEEWKNVKLTLSTGNPTVSGSKPELTPDYLNFGMYYSGGPNAITKVTGHISSSDDRQPLPGVTIRVKGTSIGTQTDAAGNYSLQVPANNPTLVFGYIGYANQELQASSSVINVIMQAESNALNEVVVVGYANEPQYKRDLTGSVATLNGKAAGIMIRGNSSILSIPVAVNQTENQTNIEFNIDNPYTIPADGKQYLVEIQEVNTDAIYQYYVAPKLSTDVFLTARITDWNKFNFLSGEANLFFEGTFIGKSLIDTHVATDTLNLSLGVDKNIVVTRTLQKELNGKQTFGANKKETRDWLITVKNRKNQPINLLTEDQVPVSRNSDIEVNTQDISGAEMNKLTGKTSWSLVVNSQAEKQLHLKYQVKYPKNQSVIVQ